MDNRERFVNSLLYQTRNGNMTWSRVEESPERDSLPIVENLQGLMAYFAHSGENNIFTYYIVKCRDASLVFVCCIGQTVAFTLIAKEMDNPVLLKALFDTAAAPYIQKKISQMLKSLRAKKGDSPEVSSSEHQDPPHPRDE